MPEPETIPDGESVSAPALLTLALNGWGGVVASSVRDLFQNRLQHPVLRGVWLLVVLPVITVKLLLDGLCLLLDSLLFPRARDWPLPQPVFVVGPPRSGTTFLHRMLALDRETFCTSPAWEVFLAPSILQKKLFRGLLHLDRGLGRPLVRTVRFLETRLLRAYADTHPGSLADPEEDYFYLGSICACTGWLLAFPSWTGLHALMPGQPGFSREKQRLALGFYRSCLQKQAYVDGGDRTLLSKNASFASWMDVLPELFPDARFLVCMRDPAETVPSMLSTAEASLRGAYADAEPHRLQAVLLDEMSAHYRVVSQVVPTLPAGRAMWVKQPDLKTGLEEVIRSAEAQLGLDFSAGFWENLPQRSADSRSHTSSHRYELSEFGLTAEQVWHRCPTPFADDLVR